MAKKDVPAPIAQLKALKPINSKLATHCKAYAVNGNVIFMSSIIPYVEKIAFLAQPEEINCFNHTLINALEMRAFMSSYRKTKSELLSTEKFMNLRDKEKEVEATVHYTTPTPEDGVMSYVEKGFYQKIGTDPLITDIMLHQVDHRYGALSNVELENLQSGSVVKAHSPAGVPLYLSKTLFGDIKNTQTICFYDMAVHTRDNRIHYVVFEQEEPCGMTIATLAAVMSAE